MDAKINISRNLFITICGITVILLILFLKTLFTKEPPPIDVNTDNSAWRVDVPPVPFASNSPTKKYLSDQGIHSLVLLDDRGRFIWASAATGEPIKPCGKADPDVEGCNGLDMKKLKIKTWTSFSVLGVEASDCVIGRHQGLLGWMHKYPASAGHVAPCHH